MGLLAGQELISFARVLEVSTVVNVTVAVSESVVMESSSDTVTATTASTLDLTVSEPSKVVSSETVPVEVTLVFDTPPSIKLPLSTLTVKSSW